MSDWWPRLAATALVGTGRAPVPPLPEALAVGARDDASAEIALLDSVALAAAWRRAGRTAPQGGATPRAASPADPLPEASARALQVLRLLLGQPPVSKALRGPAVVRWCVTAAERGRRPSADLLVPLLAHGTADATVRPAVAGVLGRRGRWLAEERAAWRWAVADERLDDVERLPEDQVVARLAAERLRDPDAARTVLARVLGTATPARRAALVQVLVIGLTADDEALLESALDGRAAAVRTAAAEVLDRLPGSARAARNTERLRALVTVGGRLRHRLEVAAPPAPDAAGTRDGLGATRPGLEHVLDRIVAGAPLDVLTTLAGASPRDVLRMDTAGLLRPGLRAATIVRRDAAWARALLRSGWDPALVAVLPDEERDDLAREHLSGAGAGPRATEVLDAVDGPWGPALSGAVVQALRRADLGGSATLPLDGARAVDLAVRLHPDVTPAVTDLLTSARGTLAAAETAAAATGVAPEALAAARIARSRVAGRVQHLLDLQQYLSLTQTIDEAFA